MPGIPVNVLLALSVCRGNIEMLTHHIWEGAHRVVCHAIWHELHDLSKVWSTVETHIREAICAIETEAAIGHAMAHSAN